MSTDYLKAATQYFLPKHALTRLAGHFADVKTPKIKNYLIKNFIRQYGVDMSEALEEDPEKYPTFNDFFIRHLKPDCRPLANADVISPVDGCISEIGYIAEGQLLQAKGRYYSVEQLLASNQLVSSSFEQGSFATLYLSPKDYHRVHMPIDATLKEMTYVPGKLFSVQPATTRTIPHLFARNERLVIFFETQAGLMAMVLVGATIVGAIGTSWHGDIFRSYKQEHFLYTHAESKNLKQGEEMGYFKLGSTVILLFANDASIQWEGNLTAGSPIRLGQALANRQG